MNLEPTDTQQPLAIYFRMAQAAPEVIERHADNEVIASTGEGVVAASADFRAGYQTLDGARTKQSTLLTASEAQRELLDRATAGWLVPLSRDLPGLDASSFRRRPEVAADVISDGQRLIEVLKTEASALPYAERAIAVLGTAVEAAESAHNAAQSARIELQERQADVRRLAARLQAQLVVLRRALRVELGTRHHDYQRLRVVRVRAEVAEGQPSTTTSAAAEVGPVNGHPLPAVTGNAK